MPKQGALGPWYQDTHLWSVLYQWLCKETETNDLKEVKVKISPNLTFHMPCAGYSTRCFKILTRAGELSLQTQLKEKKL